MVRPAVALLVFALCFVGYAGARAQTRPAAENIMPLLLEEVRGLRAAMEHIASSGARAQLALGRLQMQEERLNTATRRLDDTRTRLAQMQRSVAEQQEQLALMEAAIKENQGQPPGGRLHGDAPSERDLENMLQHQRRQIELNAAEVLRLSGEESSLASDVASEQARWSELNARLEEIERSLGR